MLRALGEVLGPDDRVLVIDDNSPDGTGELADRLAAELGRRRGAPPATQGGPRPGLSRRASAGRSSSARSSSSRSTATSPTIRPTCRACSPAPPTRTSCWARATCRAAASRTGAPCAVRSRPAARSMPACCSASRFATSPAASSASAATVLETIDLDAIHSKGYAFQIETDLSRAPPRLSRARDPDPLRRPRGRGLEDVALDRARGDLEGAAAPLRGAAEAVCERGHRRDVRGGGAPGRRRDDRRLLGAVVQALCRRSSRSSRRSPPTTGSASCG